MRLEKFSAHDILKKEENTILLKSYLTLLKVKVTKNEEVNSKS